MKSFFKNMISTLYKQIFRVCGIFMKPNKKMIIFESFMGKKFSDNPRAIYEYMKSNYPGYELIWSADRRYVDTFKDHGVEYVTRLSFKWIVCMNRAKYWVTNSRLPLWIPKAKHTCYIQTWHGTPLKKLGVDIDTVRIPGTDTQKYKDEFLKEASKWDYLVSPNTYSTESFRRAFGFEKKVIESGYPRNDFLINSSKDSIEQINTLLKLPKDKKFILYAPTWRDNQFYSVGKYQFNLELDLKLMKEELGSDYVVLLRTHYLVAENLDLTGYEDFCLDFSMHEDIRELYLISDILITDYSSVFFDYANLKRPMIFFVYDIEDYRDNLRGFYFDFEEKAPGPLVKNTKDLIKEI